MCECVVKSLKSRAPLATAHTQICKRLGFDRVLSNACLVLLMWRNLDNPDDKDSHKIQELDIQNPSVKRSQEIVYRFEGEGDQAQ